MKKVGIFGGTFNPIHMAHLLIAESAIEEAGLDEVVFMPSGCSYLKKAEEILPAEDRLRMTELAIENNPKFTLSTMETDRKGNSYTCDTLIELRKRYPEWELYLIVGADSLFAIEEWKDPEIIFQNCEILAAARGDKEKEDIEEKIADLKAGFGARVSLLPACYVEISSSKIRERLAAGKSVRYMVPDKVLNDIIEHGFYTGAADVSWREKTLII